MCACVAVTNRASSTILELAEGKINRGSKNAHGSQLIHRIFQIKNKLAKALTKAKKIVTTETAYFFLIERARENMHLVLCMSPIGDAFRNRLRQYPSLINCTTIDWFLEWPREALLEVGNKFLMNLNLTLTITGESKVVGTPCPFPRDRFHSIRFLRSTRVSYHQSSIGRPLHPVSTIAANPIIFPSTVCLTLMIWPSAGISFRRPRIRDWSLEFAKVHLRHS
jgi:hypothetical protein